ncbi:MAG: hypothetical protein KC636_26090 [Myxococcales bacterium]|nr:hypothetical protein [Myxococcales bacterium]
MNDLVRDAPADPAAFMASLARLPAPSPAPVTARTLLRRAKLRRQIALWRRREWYARVPALCMEAAALVTVAISTTCWLGERWGLARGLLGELSTPLHVPLSLTSAVLYGVTVFAVVVFAALERGG